MFWVLGLAALAAVLLVKRAASGSDAFDHLPTGLTRGGVQTTGSVTGASGRVYDTYVWPQNAEGRTFHVAKDRANGAWISWWAVAPTGTRTLYLVSSPAADGSVADIAEVAELRKDFGA